MRTRAGSSGRGSWEDLQEAGSMHLSFLLASAYVMCVHLNLLMLIVKISKVKTRYVCLYVHTHTHTHTHTQP